MPLKNVTVALQTCRLARLQSKGTTEGKAGHERKHRDLRYYMTWDMGISTVTSTRWVRQKVLIIFTTRVSLIPKSKQGLERGVNASQGRLVILEFT